jgi:sugar-specific transcriptional regulator TrmB
MSILQINEVIKILFSQLGFSEKETKVYTVLLEKGELPAGEIVKASGLKRGITYAVLYELEEKGLVKFTKKGTRTIFQPESPHKLLELVEVRKEQINAIENTLKYSIPKLMSQYKLALGKPTVQFYEGEESIRDLLHEISDSQSEEIYQCVDLDAMQKILPSDKKGKIIANRSKHNYKSYTIFIDTKQAQELSQYDDQEVRMSILINKDKYPLPAEIDVYEDKIGMISLNKGNYIGVVIENKAFATTLRSIFKLAFETNYKKSSL